MYQDLIDFRRRILTGEGFVDTGMRSIYHDMADRCKKNAERAIRIEEERKAGLPFCDHHPDERLDPVCRICAEMAAEKARLARITETVIEMGGNRRDAEMAIELDGCVTGGTLARLMAFCTAPKGCTYICGNTGTGKTVLAHAVLRQCAKNRTEATYINFADMIGVLRSAVKQNATDATMERFRGNSLLIIDDIFCIRSTEWVASEIFSIVDARLRGSLPTIAVGNLSVDEIALRYDSRLASRMQQFYQPKLEMVRR